MRKLDFAHVKTKAQISCAVIAQLISAFISYSTNTQNFKLLDIFCSCSGRFMLDLVRNPDDRFSRITAHLVHGDKKIIKKTTKK